MKQRAFKPLGSCQDKPAGCRAIDPKKLKVEDRLTLLEEQISYMSQAIQSFTHGEKKDRPDGRNKDGIPVGVVAIGETEKSPFKFYLTVLKDGYQVGTIKYESLSAAAEAVSKVRRSGWTFWRLPDGRTLKEAYK